MEQKQSTNINCGGGFLGLLTIVFVIAKIVGFIDWSWWLVFTPTIVGALLFILAFIFIIIVAALDY